MQFYDVDSALIESLREYVSDGLSDGDACIVIATEPHRAALDRVLVADGVDVEGARERGQFVALDAAESLATFMRDRQPDQALFVEHIGGVVLRASSRFGHVRAYGEMVGLLVEAHEPDAAMELECTWNDFQAAAPVFALLCGYSNASLTQAPATFAGHVRGAHSGEVPEGHSLAGTSLETLETTQTILRSAPRGPQPLEFLAKIAEQFGLAGATFEQRLATLEATGEAEHDAEGNWSASRP
ncbi:MAG: MEDS domain-containing protein [Dehalococcoidia bacterium]